MMKQYCLLFLTLFSAANGQEERTGFFKDPKIIRALKFSSGIGLTVVLLFVLRKNSRISKNRRSLSKSSNTKCPAQNWIEISARIKSKMAHLSSPVSTSNRAKESIFCLLTYQPSHHLSPQVPQVILDFAKDNSDKNVYMINSWDSSRENIEELSKKTVSHKSVDCINLLDPQSSDAHLFKNIVDNLHHCKDSEIKKKNIYFVTLDGQFLKPEAMYNVLNQG